MKFFPKYFITIVVFVCLFVIFFHIANALDTTGLNPVRERGITGINTVIGRIIKAILGIIGAFALLMIVTSGMFLLTAAGNQEKVKKGKDMLTWSIIGIMVIIGSYMMVDYIITAITEGGAGEPPPPTPVTTTCKTCTEQGGTCLTCAELEAAAGAGTVCNAANAKIHLQSTEAGSTYKCSDNEAFTDCTGLCCSKDAAFNPVPECETTGGGEEEKEVENDCTSLMGACISCPSPGCDKAAIESANPTKTCADVGDSTECGADAACCAEKTQSVCVMKGGTCRTSACQAGESISSDGCDNVGEKCCIESSKVKEAWQPCDDTASETCVPGYMCDNDYCVPDLGAGLSVGEDCNYTMQCAPNTASDIKTKDPAGRFCKCKNPGTCTFAKCITFQGTDPATDGLCGTCQPWIPSGIDCAGVDIAGDTAMDCLSCLSQECEPSSTICK